MNFKHALIRLKIKCSLKIPKILKLQRIIKINKINRFLQLGLKKKAKQMKKNRKKSNK